MPQQLNQLIGAIADQQGILIDAALLRERLTQIMATSVRIELRIFERRSSGSNRLRRRTKGIFIRCKLSNSTGLKAVFPSHILDRLSGS